MSEYLDLGVKLGTFIFRYENYLNWLKGVEINEFK